MTDPSNVRSDALYRIAREATDEVLGAGAYAEANRGTPDPRVREQVEMSAKFASDMTALPLAQRPDKRT